MNRKQFIKNSAMLGIGSLSGRRTIPGVFREAVFSASKFKHRLPHTDGHYKVTAGYIEDNPVPGYTWAPDNAYEAFLDMKFGIRLHWGIYSILQLQHESWPFLDMSYQQRQAYQELYRSWNPAGFDASEWIELFSAAGARMFSFTAKHHDGFSMYDTSARVKSRVNWLGKKGPEIEPCNFSYSIMDTPFKRDVVKELCQAARQKGLKVDLYFSHPDWYDASFRPYNHHPLQTKNAARYALKGKPMEPELKNPSERFAKSGLVVVDDPTAEEIDNMMTRHQKQLEELITKYEQVSMICLDQWLGPKVWPRLRETLLYLRKINPEIMFRARGIGNYGDYYTPEGFVPGNKENTDVPWFVIYPLGSTFSYEPDGTKYKGAEWILKCLVDSVAKGGNFMVGIGPDGFGQFHAEAKTQLLRVGKWLRQNGKGIYKTRPRSGANWKEGETLWYTVNKEKNIIYCFVEKFSGSVLTLRSVQPAREQHTRICFIDTPQISLKWNYHRASGLQIELPEHALHPLYDLERYMIGLQLTGVADVI